MTGKIAVKRGSGNVFADLGFEHPEEVTAHFEQTD